MSDVAEAQTVDGGVAASELRPLTDGTLPDRLRDVLDARGQPRLLFDIHPVSSAERGFYIVLEIHGNRRPHMTQDGTYWIRAGTSKRSMTEAEVAEAYKEKLLREHRALDPVVGSTSSWPRN